MPNTKLVQGIVVKHPVNDQSCVSLVRVVRSVEHPGDLLGATKEDCPAERRAVEVERLVGFSPRHWTSHEGIFGSPQRYLGALMLPWTGKLGQGSLAGLSLSATPPRPCAGVLWPHFVCPDADMTELIWRAGSLRRAVSRH